MAEDGRANELTGRSRETEIAVTSAEAGMHILPELEGSDKTAVETLPELPQGWLRNPPTPWRRYGARILDMAASGFTGFTLLGLAGYAIAPDTTDRVLSVFDRPGGIVINMIATVLMSAFVNGILIGMTGFTLGKLIFGIRVLNQDGTVPSIRTAWRREFHAAFQGMAGGLPLFNVVAMLIAMQGLRDKGTTAWDAGRHIVLHRASGMLQSLLIALGIGLIIAANIAMRAL